MELNKKSEGYLPRVVEIVSSKAERLSLPPCSEEHAVEYAMAAFITFKDIMGEDINSWLLRNHYNAYQDYLREKVKNSE